MIEGWRWRDALFMTVITISTVGYGETLPLTPRGELFTILLIVMGVGIAAYIFSNITDYIIAGELGGRLRRQRMTREITRMSKHYVVCGYGRVGSEVVSSLCARGDDVVVIDIKPESADILEQLNVGYLIGNAADDDLLIQAGIERAKGLCCCLPDDAGNVFVVLSARELNPELTIISRSYAEHSEAKLIKAGANLAINPYVMTSRRMVAELVHPTVVAFLDVVMREGELELQIEEQTIHESSDMDGHSLADCNIRSETGVNVLAVRRANGVILTNLNPSLLLYKGDTLIGLGTLEQLERLEHRTKGSGQK